MSNMRPCKHLDYDEETYPSCTLMDMEGFSCHVQYWRRDLEIEMNSGNPIDVQFCKQRGRINEIFACYNPGEMSCHDPSVGDRSEE